MNKSKTSLFILSTIIVLALNSCNEVKERQLPVYNPADFNPDLVDKSIRTKSEFHTVSNFSLTNQNGKIITQEDYKDKIYVVDFFFTRCPSICPIMTDNMIKIQREFLDNPEIMLLSLSVTPDIDSVSVLKKMQTLTRESTF